MSRSRIVFAAFAAVMLSSHAASADTYQTDGELRTRVEFPLHHRFMAEGGLAVFEGVSLHAKAQLELELSADFSDEAIWWQLRHDLLRFEVLPAAYRATLVEGDYLRHDEASTILVPLGRRDLKLPGPFDIAVSYTLAQLSWDDDSLVLRTGQIGVLADFVRDETHRHRLAFGVLGDHTATRADDWTHQVVPFSAVTAIFGTEGAHGRTYVRAQPTIARRFSESGWEWAFMGRLDAEWTVLAINDVPVALFASGEADLSANGDEWRIASGIRIGIPL